MKESLFDKTKFVEFYDDRYSNGYMDDWPPNKKQRVFELVKSLNLPEYGEALDFGCGNGVFTEVIKQALPRWNVYGSDISIIAIQNARQRFADCTFFVADDVLYKEKKFDFLLTHHVLEHVYNIEDTIKLMSKMVSNEGSMLHILPSGNAGSLEHNLCIMQKNGIDHRMGNRFFFEDEGHIRRLTTEKLSELVAGYGFVLHKHFYGNQYYGAIKWMTDYDKKLIYTIANPANGTNVIARAKLMFIRQKLLLIRRARNVKSSTEQININDFGIKKELKSLYVTVINSVYKLIYSFYMKQAEKEWKHSNKQINGSEMYLFFSRFLKL